MMFPAARMRVNITLHLIAVHTVRCQEGDSIIIDRQRSALVLVAVALRCDGIIR